MLGQVVNRDDFIHQEYFNPLVAKSAKKLMPLKVSQNWCLDGSLCPFSRYSVFQSD